MYLSTAPEVSQDAVWAVYVPRHGAREEEVRPSGLEHPLRVQRVGPPYQYEADAGKRVCFYLQFKPSLFLWMDCINGHVQFRMMMYYDILV